MSENQDKRKYLLEYLKPRLKEQGFRKRASTFYRSTDTNLYQIIGVSLAPNNTSTLGYIMIECGVYTDEWHNFMYLDRLKSIGICDCEIRDCFCILPELKDIQNYFEIPEDPSEVISFVHEIVLNRYLPYLDKLKTRKDIYEMYKIHKSEIGLPPCHEISMAVLMWGAGDLELALKMADKACESENCKEFPWYETVRDGIAKNDIGKYPRERYEAYLKFKK